MPGTQLVEGNTLTCIGHCFSEKGQEEFKMSEILIVEDNGKFRQTLKSMILEQFPTVSVMQAANGKEAMEKVDGTCPRLIFMDIKLPGENGFELTKHIKNLCPDVCIAILTSHDLPEYRELAHESGADHFFAKGKTKSDEILALVQSVINV
jgi:two-component system response regulator YesN